MNYLNQFHKESSQRKMKQIDDWRKTPTDLRKALENQRNRERLTKIDKNHDNQQNTNT
jgi:3-methyladenine DNA glycosylase AlkC